MPTSNSFIAKRIPYLDGLRAYSIAAVVLGHASRFIPWTQTKAAIPLNVLFMNGRFGVRVFFVLSGFLITTLLLKEVDTKGRISLSGFYERRIARIVPAFYFFLLTLLALTLLHLIDLNWTAFVTAITFTWNYGVLWGAPTPASDPVMGHLWTLSLEEQFYLVWPACLILLGKRWAERLAIGCVLAFPVIRLAWYFLFPSMRGQLLMMFQTGSDTIMWGAAAAFFYQRGACDWLARWKFRTAIPWFCGVVIFLVCPVMEAYIRGSGILLGISLECGSVVLMIFWLLSGSGGVVRRVLDSWPLVQLGLLSYSLYIWQSLFIFWDRIMFVPLPLRILGALLVAAFSYWVIEIPLRGRIRRWFAQSQPAH